MKDFELSKHQTPFQSPACGSRIQNGL